MHHLSDPAVVSAPSGRVYAVQIKAVGLPSTAKRGGLVFAFLLWPVFLINRARSRGWVVEVTDLAKVSVSWSTLLPPRSTAQVGRFKTKAEAEQLLDLVVTKLRQRVIF